MLLPVFTDDTFVDPLCLIPSIKAMNLKGKIVCTVAKMILMIWLLSWRRHNNIPHSLNYSTKKKTFLEIALCMGMPKNKQCKNSDWDWTGTFPYNCHHFDRTVEDMKGEGGRHAAKGCRSESNPRSLRQGVNLYIWACALPTELPAHLQWIRFYSDFNKQAPIDVVHWNSLRDWLLFTISELQWTQKLHLKRVRKL